MILVTGATGLVGAHLCLELLEKKIPLIALYRRDKKKEATRAFFNAKGKQALFNKIEWRKADLCNLPELTKAFEGITQVYHCAAYISMAYHKQVYLQEVNQQGTAYIANLCIENNIKKLAYVSSIAALGSETTSAAIDETTAWNPTEEKTPYAYSKYGAELEVWRASQEGVPVVIVNPGVILGDGMPRTPYAQLVTQTQKGIRFYPEGKTGYVAVEDVVDALINLMESSIENERYILVAENWLYKDIITFIAKAMGKQEPKWRLKPAYLYIVWFFESCLSLLKLRHKFLTRALIRSLSDKRTIDGSKILSSIQFNYRPIDAYLKELIKN